MLAKVIGGGLEGVNGFLVDVEACIANGMIGFDIVGLPSVAVSESSNISSSVTVTTELPCAESDPAEQMVSVMLTLSDL